jgi:hypothetical protein
MESTDLAWGGTDGDQIDGVSGITEYIHGTLDATSKKEVGSPATSAVDVNLSCKWDLMEANMWKLIRKADTAETKATKVQEENRLLKETLEVVAEEKVALEGQVTELQDSVTGMTLDLMSISNEVYVLSEILSNIRTLADTRIDEKKDSFV